MKGRVVGWVIAADENDAQRYADEKYPHWFEDGGQFVVRQKLYSQSGKQILS